MYFINDINFEAAGSGSEPEYFPAIADLIDSAIAGTINFDHIQTVPLSDTSAGRAFITGIDDWLFFRNYRFGQQAGGRGFPHSPWAGKNKSMAMR